MHVRIQGVTTFFLQKKMATATGTAQAQAQGERNTGNPSTGAGREQTFELKLRNVKEESWKKLGVFFCTQTRVRKPLQFKFYFLNINSFKEMFS